MSRSCTVGLDTGQLLEQYSWPPYRYDIPYNPPPLVHDCSRSCTVGLHTGMTFPKTHHLEYMTALEAVQLASIQLASIQLASIQHRSPDYTVPCRKTVRTCIQRRYDVEREALMSQLESVPSVSITTDTWTSNSTESFITVTEHHMTDAWDLKSNVLITRAMPERHTVENLAHRLKDCVTEFSLDGKVDTCVHDNARNIECAASLCEDWGDLGCFAHTVQLTLKPAMELPLNVPQHTLIQDVPSRWNSTYLMMERLVEQQRVLSDIMLDPKLTKKQDAALNLRESHWDIIKELCVILKPLADTTAYMSTESHVSVSEIYPIVCGLVTKSLVSCSTDSSIAHRVKKAIRDDLVHRYQPESEEAARSTAALGALSDPHYKKLAFFSSKQRNITQDTLESRMDDLPLRFTIEKGDIETPSKRRKLDFLDFGSPESTLEDELQCYVNKKSVGMDPQQWWRENEERFPKVAVVARRVLSVPATPVPSERLFCSTGLLLSKLRNRLSSCIVDAIVFLNKNRVNVCDVDENEA
ncbi:zinc finger BED domain-containing protein 4-like [Dreissena polymorpha]|uniref:zinc finger BED domain-containing protein 4-like n=1 Tax=Dreissena polymorpha TaxID=45954 RepID=UPI00226544C3|nr:zinc finger BED domain-containing protein 4-like [Dreissena polymorpha]